MVTTRGSKRKLEAEAAAAADVGSSIDDSVEEKPGAHDPHPQPRRRTRQRRTKIAKIAEPEPEPEPEFREWLRAQPCYEVLRAKWSALDQLDEEMLRAVYDAHLEDLEFERVGGWTYADNVHEGEEEEEEDDEEEGEEGGEGGPRFVDVGDDIEGNFVVKAAAAAAHLPNNFFETEDDIRAFEEAIKDALPVSRGARRGLGVSGEAAAAAAASATPRGGPPASAASASQDDDDDDDEQEQEQEQGEEEEEEEDDESSSGVDEDIARSADYKPELWKAEKERAKRLAVALADMNPYTWDEDYRGPSAATANGEGYNDDNDNDDDDVLREGEEEQYGEEEEEEEEEEDGNEDGDDSNDSEAIDGAEPAPHLYKWRVYLHVARALNFMARMREEGIDPFDAGAIQEAYPGGYSDISASREESRDKAEAVLETLFDMEEEELLELYEMAEGYEETLKKGGINIVGSIFDYRPGELYY